MTGEARYASDVPLGNPAYAFLVTSAIAKGRIDSIDLARGEGGAAACSTSSPTRTPDELKDAKLFSDGGCGSTIDPAADVGRDRP